MAKSAPVPRRLFRSADNKVIAGVCGGLGEYLGLDPVVVRLVFVLLLVFGGSGLLLYLVFWLVIPSENSLRKNPDSAIRENAREIDEKARKIFPNALLSGRAIFGIALVVIGALYFVEKSGCCSFIFRWELVFPALLILLGLALVFRK